VWEAVITGPFEAVATGGYLLTTYVRNNTIELQANLVVEAAATPQVLVLGARHPDLQRYDLRYHAHHRDAVLVPGVTRSAPPAPPLAVTIGD